MLISFSAVVAENQLRQQQEDVPDTFLRSKEEARETGFSVSVAVATRVRTRGGRVDATVSIGLRPR